MRVGLSGLALSLIFQFVIASGGAGAALGAEAEGGRLTLVSPGHEHTYSLRELRSKLKTVTVEVDDPMYKRKVTFDGFELGDVLALLGPAPAGIDDVLFTAKDGYTPGIAAGLARAHRGIVVFGEHGNPKRFSPMNDGKAKVDPAPFYVVWTEKLGEEYPRPYQLVRIELVSYEQKYPKLFPKGAAADSPVSRGFKTFRSQCLRCHSINLEGGAIGPELNIPRNITEYWSTGNLRQFIHKVSAFRAKSKMPDFDKELTDDDVAAVVEYLEFMKDLKQPETGAGP